jgi:hypothetical protein
LLSGAPIRPGDQADGDLGVARTDDQALEELHQRAGV